jgi:S-adenosylmethionine:tRNA ribosyltransferase-isomerase
MSQSPRNIQIEHFNYDLPEDRIAKFPLEQRDASNLLLYSSGAIIDKKFSDLVDLLEPGDLLVANQTRVVLARLEFRTQTGARIEVFCLEPTAEHFEIQIAMQKTSTIEWKCLVGNSKKWKDKEELLLKVGDIELKAVLLLRDSAASIVRFSWSPEGASFAELLDSVGNLPLPPYLKREVKQSDFERYQTVYSKDKGSVAAPTAGLHFTQDVLKALRDKGVNEGFLTLHVGAGTFMPVKSDKMSDHHMHSEEIVVTRDLLKQLVKSRGRLIAVGTTTLRSLESLYWTAVRIMNDRSEELRIDVKQWEPYENTYAVIPAWPEAFSFLLMKMELMSVDVIRGQTELLIAPGYSIKTADAILTNFHQPKSTLLLLVSACIGDDWEKVYKHALLNEYRFLSYGDSSLLYIIK